MSFNFAFIEFHCLLVWQPPRPNISHLRAISDKQSLLVSWLVNHSGLVGDFYEIQIGRTENHTIIYNVGTDRFVVWSYSGDAMDNHKLLWNSCAIFVFNIFGNLEKCKCIFRGFRWIHMDMDLWSASRVCRPLGQDTTFLQSVCPESLEQLDNQL